MKNQIKYFYIGLFFLVLAMLDITIAPLVLKRILDGVYIPNNFYMNSQIVFLALSSFFYFLTPRYYKKIMLTIVLALLYYILFTRIYSLFM